MRRPLLAIMVILAALAAAGQAAANMLTLAEPVQLRAGPGARHRVVASAPAGATLVVLRDGEQWTKVSLDGRRGYVATATLVEAPPVAVAPADDPTCDYGYPYSGSGLFFSPPHTQFRHSGLLGFFLGYHRRYPC
ncbi:SH3 domain-containing protein [Methylocystis sp. ATCC 49242]|uniref:SH3 domain-containing protein n=1 Tax=Methylocystis sp. ATCC 49242 TaxID=622637 RepID=UPI0001F8714C|nr:SH3 domain-containing protein [Methylocystis sp. ATCC 49242]